MTNATYQSIPIRECGEPLLDLSFYPFVLEPKYFQLGLSDTPKLYAREGIVVKLLKIQERLNGLTFKIWDAWRSRVVQNNIYQKCWNDLQTQHPAWDTERLKLEVGVFCTDATDINRIPPHATGGALDLTLADVNGLELRMGTEFDHFGPKASMFYYDQTALDAEIATNRKLLREAMLFEGFSYYKDEWWHFDYGNQFWAFQTNRPFAIYGGKREVRASD